MHYFNKVRESYPVKGKSFIHPHISTQNYVKESNKVWYSEACNENAGKLYFDSKGQIHV
jgi:hypothetical protein